MAIVIRNARGIPAHQRRVGNACVGDIALGATRGDACVRCASNGSKREGDSRIAFDAGLDARPALPR